MSGYLRIPAHRDDATCPDCGADNDGGTYVWQTSRVADGQVRFECDCCGGAWTCPVTRPSEQAPLVIER